MNAYRVGMLAMETLARRVQDDRPQNKYAPHPPYGEEIKWLLVVAKKLGRWGEGRGLSGSSVWWVTGGRGLSGSSVWWVRGVNLSI